MRKIKCTRKHIEVVHTNPKYLFDAAHKRNHGNEMARREFFLVILTHIIKHKNFNEQTIGEKYLAHSLFQKLYHQITFCSFTTQEFQGNGCTIVLYVAPNTHPHIPHACQPAKTQTLNPFGERGGDLNHLSSHLLVLFNRHWDLKQTPCIQCKAWASHIHPEHH